MEKIMKNSRGVANSILVVLSMALCVAFCVSAFTGCGKKRDHGPVEAEIKIDSISYEEKGYAFEIINNSNSGKSCSTYKRTAISQEELCRNLQLGEQNNYCAKKHRRFYFKEQCPNQDWNPIKAREQLKESSALMVTCYVSDEKATHQELGMGTKYIVTQTMMGHVMVIVNEDFKVVVYRKYADDRVALRIEVKSLTGETLATEQRTWKMKSEDKQPFEVRSDAKGALCTLIPQE